ncbi:Glycolipid transfer protein [Armadillidium vulgare]|nr:Glycolipid transfer protein [Armadillidium vulgare]
MEKLRHISFLKLLDHLFSYMKLTKVYNKCPEKYKYLNDLIYLEKDDPKVFAVDALLWLKRALEFTSCLMNSLISEGRSGTPRENLSHLVGSAYEKMLKKHHNWFVQNLFKVILTAFPTRSGIIRIFYYGEDGPEDPAIEALETYIAELDCNLEVIVKFYDEWGLEKIEDSSDKKKTGN